MSPEELAALAQANNLRYVAEMDPYSALQQHNNSVKLITASTGKPEVRRVADGQYVVSHELRDLLSPNEVNAYVPYAITQMRESYNGWGAAAVAGLAAGTVAGTIDSQRDAALQRYAEEKQNQLDAMTGNRTRKEAISRRNFLTGMTAGAAALLAGGATKAASVALNASSDLDKVVEDPTLASAIRKINEWNRRHGQPPVHAEDPYQTGRGL